jgi:hypothetical protein
MWEQGAVRIGRSCEEQQSRRLVVVKQMYDQMMQGFAKHWLRACLEAALPTGTPDDQRSQPSHFILNLKQRTCA